jgi:DNA polymerase-3 subunit epsilon
MSSTRTKEEVVVDEMDLVFFDTETTGLDLRHELIEIGLVKVRAKTLEVIAERDIKIKPTRIADAHPDALRINGYNEAEWAEAYDLRSGLIEFLSYTKDCMLVGHNLAFDWMQVKNSLEKSNLEPNYYYKGLDTFTLAWEKLRGTGICKRYSLKELAPHFGIDPGHAHRAIDDARTTYQIFKKLIALPSPAAKESR